MSNERYFPGLEGVIAGETAISTVEGGLTYRGYTIEDLARQSSFLEVAYLLLYDDLPSQEDLADFQSVLSESEDVDPSILEFLAHVPLHVPAMDVLRTGAAARRTSIRSLPTKGWMPIEPRRFASWRGSRS